MNAQDACRPERPNWDEFIDALPVPEIARRRVRMTVGCGDARPIPKVPGAGTTVVEGNGTRAQIMHNGVRVVEGGYHGAWMAAVIRILEGHHEPQEELAFHEILRHLRPGANMVELGSFWAYYSLWFARAVPGGRAVMVEPDPHNLEVGRKNFELNGERGEFHHASVGRAFLPPRPFPCESDGRFRPVPEVCVDDLARDCRLPRIDLLLADIQGAELDMLHGAARSIEQGLLRFASISTHHHDISGDPLTHQKCLAFVREHGGRVLVEHSVAESYSGDGLIVASFDPADRNLPPIHVSRNHPSNCCLFRETEYDLAEAWGAIADAGRSLGGLAGGNPQVAGACADLRARHKVLTRLWPEVERPALPESPAEEPPRARPSLLQKLLRLGVSSRR